MQLRHPTIEPRPLTAGPAMPAGLDLPKLDLPGPTDAGRPLADIGTPPAPGSAAAARDLRISHALVKQRTDVGDDWARALDLHGATKVWREMGDRIVSAESPATVQGLIGAALSAASTQAGVAKRQFNRQRPFQVDPTITVVGRTPKGPDTSFPSGHTARAFAAARIVSTLDPSMTADAYAMAREVAMSRIYAGVHFASDVLAGARLGTAVADSLVERWRNGTLEGVDGIVDGARPLAA